MAAVDSVSPAVFLMLKKADARTTSLVLRLGSIACGGRLGPVTLVGVVTAVALCAILRDELCKLASEFGKFRRYAGGEGGGGARVDISLMVSMAVEGAVYGF